VLGFAGAAAAHGGQYTGAAAPAAPGGSRGDAVSKGASTGALADNAGAFTGWQFWWEYNKHALLLERQRDLDGSAVTADSGHLTGRGRSGERPDGRRADRARIDSEVLPALRALLENEDQPDILDSAVLALARSADEPEAPGVIEAATPLLKSRVASVQSSAALSLGVLASPQAVPDITALLVDDMDGRGLTGRRGRVPDLVRAFAALALGLANDADSVAILADVIGRTPDKEQDLKGCAIVALGLMDNAASEQASRVLLGLLEERRLSDVLKAQVPTALARLASRPDAYDPSVLPALVRVFTHKRTRTPVRQSLALALGRVGEITAESAEQDETVAALLAAVARDGDLATRQFSLMALARIGARDANAERHPGVHAALQELFVDGLDSPDRRAMRPWAALAAAYYVDGQPYARDSLLPRVRDAYDDELEPGARSAYALALGILRDTSRGERLLEDFRHVADGEFRGCAGLALGLLGHDAAADELRAACRDPSLSGTSRMRIARGLGLMGDREVSDVLVATLGTSRSVPVCAGVAGSLGLVGESSALAPLGRIAADEQMTDITRAFACVALGMLCEKTELPWNHRLSEDCNYLSLVPALGQALDIL
jgi:HEAT repeat protein